MDAARDGSRGASSAANLAVSHLTPVTFLMYMASGVVDVRVTGSVGTILLNRPQRRNALSRAMGAELQQAFDDLHLERRGGGGVVARAGAGVCGGGRVPQ